MSTTSDDYHAGRCDGLSDAVTFLLGRARELPDGSRARSGYVHAALALQGHIVSEIQIAAAAARNRAVEGCHERA